MLLQIRRWYPEREIVAVADSAYASLKLPFRCRSLLSKPVTFQEMRRHLGLETQRQ